jgi:deoxyribodipyrimidine photo-lyase
MPELKRTFVDRAEMEAYLRAEFPEAEGGLSPWRGGLAAAEHKLGSFDGRRYAGTRNFLDGAVSGLGPYIRHGVLTLRQVAQRAMGSVKFVQELAWRDYWRRVHYSIGDGIWDDREAPKTGRDASDYANELPADIQEARTGLACMDAFARELTDQGTMHNHARMWFAAYVVHWRRVRWQAGARWFLRHLLDGDPASNNLSWQWVASTFAGKPYIFNRENLEHYSRGRYCRDCARASSCPFDRDYPALSEELFPRA